MSTDNRKYGVRFSAHGAPFAPATPVFDKTYAQALAEKEDWEARADTVGGLAEIVAEPIDLSQFAYDTLKTEDGREVIFYASLDTEGVLEQRQAGAMCSQGKDGAFILLNPKRINLQSIVHEVDHAVDWCAALGALNGREEEARYAGFWFEQVLAELLRAGWTWTSKDTSFNVFNTDVIGLTIQAPE